MNTRFKVFASYNILQNPCDFIHVLIFVTVSKCQKNPKLTNIMHGRLELLCHVFHVIMRVLVLWLWVLIMCAVLGGCKICDLVGALGNVLEALFRYEGAVMW
jgi:hypothetical protein